jgi:DNA-binding transcriptional regulator YhcF (GntR family)
LSRWLLRARDLCGSENLPPTQQLLAQMIGAQRNAVSIVAHALHQAGIVSYSRGQTEITNLEGLRETSCECYEVVKARYAGLLKPSDQTSAGTGNRLKSAAICTISCIWPG